MFYLSFNFRSGRSQCMISGASDTVSDIACSGVGVFAQESVSQRRLLRRRRQRGGIAERAREKRWSLAADSRSQVDDITLHLSLRLFRTAMSARQVQLRLRQCCD